VTQPQIDHTSVIVNGVSLHVAQAGPADGPLVVLLHGFPEFWFEWRDFFSPLAQAGFRVVAPDQRGYNLSSKPQGVAAYRLDLLADDIFALADALGRKTFRVVGHDWGATVAWWMATRNQARLERLVTMDAPHPAVWMSAVRTDREQRRKSWYVQALRIPWLPEFLIRLGGYSGLTKALTSAARKDAFTPEILAQYKTAWRQPGALTAMINWYRAVTADDLTPPPAKSLNVPTLILWGDKDIYVGPKLAEACAALCADARVVHFPQAGHWLPHDEREAVTAHLLAFLKA
jgi:pimeloyl-ACP methyl ester carboxylesterase